MNKFTFIDLFSGIGGFHIAAQRNGGKCLFACEMDQYAKQAYFENYKIKPFGDIAQIDASGIPDHDLLCAGFPCQPFSIIGNRLGFDDMRGTLFYEIARILQAKKPPMIVLENVKQLSTHNKKQTLNSIINALQEIGYKVCWKVLNALDYGLPQKRERTIITGFMNHKAIFRWPDKTYQHKPLREILEEKVSSKYYASHAIQQKRKAKHQSKHPLSIWHENKGGNVSSHPYSCALRAGASYNYLLVNGKRRLTPREMLRLQGFPDDFRIISSDSQTRKQVGNAVPVPMVEAVIKEVLYANSEVKRQQSQKRRRDLPFRRIPEKNNIRNRQVAYL